MNKVDNIRRLWQENCFRWTKIGDQSVIDIVNNARKPVKASLRCSGSNPYYGANNIQDFVDGYTHEGEHVLVAEDGSSSLENYSVQMASGKFWANNHVHVLRGTEKLNTRFLYYYLCRVNFLPFLTGGGRAKLTKGQLMEIPIPVPCPENTEMSLSVQAEIVRILDTFNRMSADLSGELAARKKQLSYYREKLLNYSNVDLIPLDQLAVIKAGQPINKNVISESTGLYPVINSGREPLGYYSQWNTENDPIGITSRGAGVGSVTWREGRYFRGNLNYSVSIKEPMVLDVHFLYHILEHLQPSIRQLCTYDGIPALNAGSLKELKVPVPALDEQIRVATILDRFDTLANCSQEGLPREIELRQKQYAYYRDILLSVPEFRELTS